LAPPLFLRAGTMDLAMSATYLIDGYNLLHAMGVLGGRMGPHGLEKARTSLLGLLHGALGEEAEAATVVFDAAGGFPGSGGEQEQWGVRVLFSKRKEEADDVIERLIRQAAAPKSLHVVSDDHRLQQAARRRHAKALGCQDFLEWLDRHRQEKQEPAAPPPEKQERLSQDEVKRWLAEFGDVERDPTLKKAFESFGFWG
jgi:uncharacterized protein